MSVTFLRVLFEVAAAGWKREKKYNVSTTYEGGVHLLFD